MRSETEEEEKILGRGSGQVGLGWVGLGQGLGLGGEGAQWAMIPKLRIFLLVVFISQKRRPKGKQPAFFTHKRNMVFADYLEIKFFPILML